MSSLVIVLEKEPATRMMILGCLNVAGIEVAETNDALGASDLLASHPDCLLIVSDDLPRSAMRSLMYARNQRRESRRCSVVMLTDNAARGVALEPENKVDAFLPRGFSPENLVERVEMLLRREAPGAHEICNLHFSGLTLESGSRIARFAEQQTLLGPTEYRMLRFLMGNAERVFSRGQLLERIWDSGPQAEERTIDVHILRLRRALARLNCDHFVQTVPRFGYRFSARGK